MSRNLSNIRLGIIGGGQLGKMLNLAALNWHLDTYILDPNKNCSCASSNTQFTEGDFTDYDTLYQFGKDKDLLTIEIEKINVDALKALEKEGVKVYPEPNVVELIQDKGLQKEFYLEKGLPSSDFILLENKSGVLDMLSSGKLTIPFVQKSRKGGYDGRGVHVVKNETDLGELMDVPCLIEDLVDIDKELAVIVARNPKGEIVAFPVVEMEFNPKANLVEFLFSPSSISKEVEDKAVDIAKTCIEEFKMTGLLAVELFLTKSGDIYVNEVAPRPHNSGHHTIEACITSQYEQHLRAILDLSLGSTALQSPAVMINVLGEPGYEGDAIYEGLEECLAVEGFKLHVYGKKDTKPFRKMGHATILDRDIEKAKEKARFVQKKLKVIA
jgi:5-(carboxyamino)imidazole ribonucleotide synthase